MKECLDRLSETGADVRFLTCDQGTSNQSAYALLDIDSQKPYFIHNEKKILCFIWFPIINKTISKLFEDTNIYCDGKIIASYLDFEMTWRIDNITKGKSHLLPHITEKHLCPNIFEAMNVRVFQLFNHTYATAIKTAGHEKELNTET